MFYLILSFSFFTQPQSISKMCNEAKRICPGPPPAPTPKPVLDPELPDGLYMEL